MKEKLAHITGLRGLAILLILFFHISNSACICGHFGVDVFIVISGFLMFRGVLPESGKERTSLVKYYKKRFCRIFPTLVVLLLLCLPFVLYYTIYSTRMEFAKTGIASLLGFANKYLDTNAPGYFQSNTISNPLAHLWYLSVVLQIYLVIPFIIIVTQKLTKTIQGIIWALIFITSALIYHHEPIFGEKTCTFITNIVDSIYLTLETLTGQDFWQSYASPYYWSSARLWEFLMGGAIPFLPETSKNKKTLLVATGILMILVPSFMFQKGCLFSLPAVIGSTLIIKYCKGSGIDGIFTNKPLVAIGLISYSLYLVHWPIYSIITQYSPAFSENALGLIGISTLSFAAAALMWKYVERKRTNVHITLASWGICATIMFAFMQHGGLDWKLPGAPDQIEPSRYRDAKIMSSSSALSDFPKEIPTFKDFYGGGINSNTMFSNHSDKPLLKLGDNNATPKFVLLGDSHANALVPAFDLFCNETNNSGAFVRAYFYPLMESEWCRGYEKWNMHITAERTESFIRWLEKHSEISHVIICVHWDFVISQFLQQENVQSMKRDDAIKRFEGMLLETCKRLQASGKSVAFITPVTLLPPLNLSTSDYLNTNLLQGTCADNSCLTLSHAAYKQKFKDVLSILRHLEEIGACDQIPQEAGLFVDGLFCAYKDGKLLMTDYNHLSFDGAILSYQGMKTSITNFLLKQPK